jgi:hypothetical protein
MKSQLPDLPDSRNEFWDGEVNVIEPKTKFFDEPHRFERVSGRQARCTHCDWGFELDPGDKIKNGHLYTKSGKKVL